MTPMARSTTLPLTANSRNSLSISLAPVSVAVNDRQGPPPTEELAAFSFLPGREHAPGFWFDAFS
jgi:hypothetical protein